MGGGASSRVNTALVVVGGGREGVEVMRGVQSSCVAMQQLLRDFQANHS